MEVTVRLDKYLSNMGKGTRSEVKKSLPEEESK